MTPEQKTINYLLAASPVSCLQYDGHPCFCNYNIYFGVNVFNCSSENLYTLPWSAPNFTNWVLLENNNIYKIHEFRDYLWETQFLHLVGNMLPSINDSFFLNLQLKKSITWLNLARNRLTGMPTKIQELTYLQKIWLSGNPFHCDCSIIWMIGWLNNFTTSVGNHIVVDYQDVICHSGTAVGSPIYKLDKVLLGCYPKGLTIWQKVIIGIGSGTAGLIIIFLLLTIVKRSRTLQFFILYKLKIKSILSLKKDLEDENVECKEYDAFLSYRLEIIHCVKVIKLDL